MKQLTPIANNIIVKLDKTKTTKTKGGVIIPDTVQEPPLHGVVVSVGYNTNKQGEVMPITSVAPGDNILIGRYSGVEFIYEDVEYRYMKESEIVAKLDDADNTDDILCVQNIIDILNSAHYDRYAFDLKNCYALLNTLLNFAKTPYEYLRTAK